MKKLIFLFVVFITSGFLAQNSVGNHSLAFALPKEGFNDHQEAFKSQTYLDLDELEFTEKDLPLIKNDLLNEGDSNIYEGMYVFTKNMKTVFFSVNRKIRGKNETSSNEDNLRNAVNLNLFKAQVNDKGEWVNLELLPFNSSQFSTGQPTLNHDDSKLFFVSDGPKSLGRTDIFSVDLKEDGTYGKPVNLGPKINSSEREIFPFIDAENVLYFSSDVTNPKRELDVFATKIFDNSTATPLKLKTSAFTEKADLASIKKTGKGEGEMYEFVASIPVLKYFDCQQKISGVVRNADNQELLPNAKIELFDQHGNKLSSLVSNKTDATFSFEQSCNSTYILRSYLDGYLTGELDIKTVNDLEAKPKEIVVNMTSDRGLQKDLVAEMPEIKISEGVLPTETNTYMAAPVAKDNVNTSVQQPYDFGSEQKVFTVQIGAFKGSAQTEKFTKVNDLFNHFYYDGLNRYYSGIFESATEAENHLRLMKEEGYQDAFIVGLKGEKRF
ncbi:MAG: SPOR domain-containing protein [Flavobacteriaceae bacterium]|nr:SPOR domain-containing protein [Flavobacteriaceae bacterium]